MRNLEAIHSVFEVKSVCIDNEEFIFGIVSDYSHDGMLMNVDTKYWRHFTHDEESGLLKKNQGTYADDMPSEVYAQFELFKTELEQIEGNRACYA